MQYNGEASDPSRGFRHQALIYDSDQEFLDVALPFVREGLASNQPTLVAVQDRNVENLSSELGGTPEGLTLYPVEQWYETSARTREKFARWAGKKARNGNRVRLIGEPPWAIGHDAQIRDWARHESVINVAFAGQPVTFICPYDARVLPDDVIGHAHDTHPQIVDPDGISSSASYEDPTAFCGRLDTSIEPQRGEPTLELTFGLEDLPAVRRAVGPLAREAGLTPARSDELVLAVNEIATNALIHGRPPATLRVWRAEEEVVVEVTDTGDGIRDVLAGQLTPPVAGPGGRGLWMTRQLCDAVAMRNGKGTTVVMHAAVPGGDRLTTA
jgi:anti-sigma regulatory factor (Ser/Thr protein kinase)